MITLRQYQETAVRELFAESVSILGRPSSESRTLVLKAPTGSGKTVMMQSYLKRLSEIPGKRLSFVWLSIGDIAGQSRRSFVKNLEDTKLRFSELSDIRGNELDENEILFVNWEKINKKDREKNWKVRAMRENERDANLPTYLENARKAGREIVLVIDESSRNLGSERAQEIIAQFIKPRLQIEVSATPDSVGYVKMVEVSANEVIESGMIRREAVMNEKIGLFIREGEGSDAVLIRAALEKRVELLAAFETEGTAVKPLVCVQLPNDGEKSSPLDKTKLDHAERILAESFDITRENGKLAVWLSDDKTDNLENIEAWDSPAEVLIFKQAIAIGWDCPRAQILVMFREIKSFSFSIQTVGRILRTPEQRHYGNALLDTAYIYTDLPRAYLSIDENVKQYFKTKSANRVSDWPGFAAPLPVERVVRTDYGDVGASFHPVFAASFLEAVGGTSGDRTGNLEKLGKRIDATVERLSESLLSDGRIALDVDERTGRVIESACSVESLSEDERTQLAFDDFLRRSVRPQFGNVARSYPIFKEALYGVLEREFFGRSKARSLFQTVVLSNREFFEKLLESAKNAYVPLRGAEISGKTERKASFWNVPFALEFPDSAETGMFSRYAFEPGWISYDSDLERRFVSGFLENSAVPIRRWYRNGEGSERYFSIPYETGTKTGNFYPDFLVEFEDGTIGIFDPKDGITLENDDARAKHEALKNYLSALNGIGIKTTGGFVDDFGGGPWRVTSAIEYVSDGSQGFGLLA